MQLTHEETGWLVRLLFLQMGGRISHDFGLGEEHDDSSRLAAYAVTAKKIQIFPACSWVILSLFFSNMAALLELVDPDPEIFNGSYLVFYFTEMLFLLLFVKLPLVSSFFLQCLQWPPAYLF